MVQAAAAAWHRKGVYLVRAAEALAAQAPAAESYGAGWFMS